MNKPLSIIVALGFLLAGGAAITKPDKQAHEIAITAADKAKGSSIVRQIEYHNYRLLTTTSFGGRQLSWGAFGYVHVDDIK